MRKLFCIFLLFISFISCQTEDRNQEILESKTISNFDFKTFIDSPIAINGNGILRLNVTEDNILNVFKEYINNYKLNLKPESFKIVTIENKKYLRFYNSDNSVSTIELIQDKDNIYKTGSTVCTSTSCASGGGCVPEGVYCTKCQPYGPDSPITGDCVRTTSGSNQQ